MPRARSLHPDRLAAAALAVIDRDGLAGLTMRAVATELAMSTMALYRYVTDRAELELLVADWCLRDLDTSVPADPQWTDQVKTLALRVRAQVGAHPQAVPLLIANRQRSRPLLRWAESVVTVLAAAGFTGTGRVIALRALVGYLNGALLQEQLGALGGPGTEAIASQTDFPVMRETARAALGVTPEQEFTGGLDIVLRGLRRSDPEPGGPPSS
ncbi:TetR/AcrR family transcriptional regulator [Paractinoplanes atraurantiacus]|uniref:Regulatory protein, tetR family n=1 Tax=Paractinoplanes atraurantiacus TaxID=1036182 RepID=A0A285F1U8_9ACTN|nr:TetR/AcrR family transcriptional regulator [Actinoplanes atraurantiacus]SNY04664.1 regulatory protein, tetR family [Actinoplanes atraurantiacus]